MSGHCALSECDNKEGLKTCSGCGIVKYCCLEHQNIHWAIHKVLCKQLAAKKKSNAAASAAAKKAAVNTVGMGDKIVQTLNQKDDVAFINKYLANGGAVDIRDSQFNGFTPLMMACYFNRLKCLKSLIVAQADVDACEAGHETTSLYIAAQKGHKECLKILIDSKATVMSIHIIIMEQHLCILLLSKVTKIV